MVQRIDPGGCATAMGEDFPAARCHLPGVDRRHHALAAKAGGDIADHLGPGNSGTVHRDLVGAGPQQRPRVAGIHQVDEVHALDHAAICHIEAGDDANADGHPAYPMVAVLRT